MLEEYITREIPFTRGYTVNSLGGVFDPNGRALEVVMIDMSTEPAMVDGCPMSIPNVEIETTDGEVTSIDYYPIAALSIVSFRQGTIPVGLWKEIPYWMYDGDYTNLRKENILERSF